MPEDTQKSRSGDQAGKENNKQGRRVRQTAPRKTPTVESRLEHDECAHYLDSPSNPSMAS